jgi:hypothetical protein
MAAGCLPIAGMEIDNRSILPFLEQKESKESRKLDTFVSTPTVKKTTDFCTNTLKTISESYHGLDEVPDYYFYLAPTDMPAKLDQDILSIKKLYEKFPDYKYYLDYIIERISNHNDSDELKSVKLYRVLKELVAQLARSRFVIIPERNLEGLFQTFVDLNFIHGQSGMSFPFLKALNVGATKSLPLQQSINNFEALHPKKFTQTTDDLKERCKDLRKWLEQNIEYFKKIQKLDFEYFGIMNMLPAELAKFFPNLRELNIRGQEIPVLPPGLRNVNVLISKICNSILADNLWIRKEKLLEKALSCPAIKELYEQARANLRLYTKHKEIIVNLVSKIKSGFPADTFNNTIEILSSRSDDEILDDFVFELTNVLQCSKHNDVFQKVIDGMLTCEDYAYQTERIEFEGTKIHHRVMQAAIKQMGWSQSLDFYKNSSNLNFNLVWYLSKFFSPHTNYYRIQWREATKKQSLPIYEIGQSLVPILVGLLLIELLILIERFKKI